MIDTNKGIWLNADRDNDTVLYTIVIDGEPFEISSNAYEELQAVYFDLIKQGEAKAEQRIIKLLDEYLKAWFSLESPNAYDTGRTDGLASAIALIKDNNETN